MKKRNWIISGIVGLLMAGLLVPFPGRGHIATGIAFGILLAYLGFLLYLFLTPGYDRDSANSGFIWKYLSSAVLRAVLLLGGLWLTVFFLKINTIGIIVGLTTAIIAFTIIALNKMRLTTKA